MRFSDLAGKELIDVREGLRLGELGDAELLFEVRTGRVRAIVVTPHGPWWRRSPELVIPWSGVRKIGVDVIVVDLGAEGERSVPASIDDGRDDHADDRWGENGDPPRHGGALWPGNTSGGSVFFFRRR